MSSAFFLIIIAVLVAVTAISVFLNIRLSGKSEKISKELENLRQQLEEARRETEEFRIRAEKLIADRTVELQERVAEQSEKDFSLKRALKRSEDATYMKNAFISNLSQEIRTPLNNIIGFSSLLEAEISILENKEMFDYARAISESGDRLLNILNNLIDISKIESHEHRITLKPMLVNPVIASAVQLFLFKANEKRLKLNFIPREVPPAQVDEKSLTRVLSIVIENAVNYTEKGFINVSTDHHPDSNEVSIRIKDTGVGIDPAFQQEIFNPFRHESAGFSKEARGAGLGLPLAKSLTDLMNGSIRIESVRGTGTTVTIILPCPPRGDETDTARSSRERRFRTLQNLEIFIVEDDLMNKMVLVQMTKSLGNVVAAMNGDETMQIMERRVAEGKPFDIMLFDINLPPPWDGVRLMQEIRNRWKEYRKIPFIAQTAYAMVGDKEKLLAEGFDDYISKPINQQELYTIMKNQLNKF